MIKADTTHPVPDDFYRAFEDRFRGSQDLIGERLTVYLPFLRAIRAQTDVAHGLDLGCGRGEWLHLLEREGFEARGVDLDDGMLDAARERGLSVENKDAIAALVDAEDASLDVVSGFHIIEHLTFPTRLALIREACRALRPGGLLILETPNPENILVGTWSFHLDPTHIAPIPPMIMPFLAEYAGFSQSVILRLNADPLEDDPSLLDVYTKVPLDYALVARTGGAENPQMDQALSTVVGTDVFGILNRYDSMLQEGIEKKNAILQKRITAELASLQTSSAALQHKLAVLQEEVERLKPRSLGQKLFFRRSGRPVKLVRRLAFHSNGRPRGGVLGRIALKKNGTPRPAFVRWMTSSEYAALPWPAGQASGTTHASWDHAANATAMLGPQSEVEIIRGPNPETHPRRYQVWSRLDSAQRHRKD